MAYQYSPNHYDGVLAYNNPQIYGQVIADYLTINLPAHYAAAQPPIQPDIILHHHIHCEETVFYGYPPNFAATQPQGLAPLLHDPAFTQETIFFHNFLEGAAAAHGVHPDYDGEVVLLDGLLVPIIAADGEDSVAPPPQPDDGLPEGVVARFLMNATCEVAADGGEPELCAVCQDDLCRKDAKVVALNCRHRFHGDCVGKWLQMKNRCPLCKAIAIDIS